ncbi:MAG: HAMP domain-containing sensor histidine kinase [Bacteroidota bacterium]
MERLISNNEQKLNAILRFAPIGLVEIDLRTGIIANINLKADEMLGPIFNFTGAKDNVFPVLKFINKELVELIQSNTKHEGVIFQDIYTFTVEVDGKSKVRHYNMLANIQIDGSLMISFDDFTERQEKEVAMREAETEKAVEQGKYEIASDVLHDIGNALVGFGSYLTRIKRSLQNNNVETLQRLSDFFIDKKDLFAATLGETKAEALIDMLSAITKNQQSSMDGIQNAVTEQLNIISHIQEIMNIQRQYVKGESKERKPVSLRNIINDCMAMLFASFDKKGISISLNLQEDVPLLKGDRTKLMQAVLNILKNSLEAIDSNSAEKKMSLDLYMDANVLVLCVKDSGSGYNTQTAEKLFERGFTTKNSGTGIGLYNCKNIIENHSGTIEMKSDGIGEGSETKIRFYLS